MWNDLLVEAAQAARGPNPASAEPIVQRLLSLRPADADALTLAGIVAQRTGRLDEAVRAFEAAQAAAPDDPARHQNLAVALKNAGRFDDALAAFEQALALRPGHAQTIANLGACLVSAGRCEEALERLEAAPRNADALTNAGVALSRLGRHNEAADRYRRSLDVRPGHLETALNLVDALASAGKTAQAEDLARKILAAQPRNIRAANQLGLLQEKAGDFSGAAKTMCGAFDHAAPSHALGVNLARVLIRGRQEAEALAICDRLIATQPSVTTPLALALAARQRLGQDAESRTLMGLDRYVSVHDIASAPGFADMDAFNAALLTELRAHPSLTFEPEGLVTRKGRQSADLADDKTPAIAALAHLARHQLSDTLARLRARPDDHPFLRAMPEEWTLTLWGTILQPGGEVGPHIHAPNWMSGVYYPQFNTDTDGDDGAFAIGVITAELGGGGTPIVMRPRAGRMILFPSYLWHTTLPFGGDRERISFAFDLVPRGVGRAHTLG